MFIVLIALWVQQTVQFTPLVLEHTLFYSLISSGDTSALGHSPADCSQFLQCRFLIPPGTHHCWVGSCSMEWEICPTFLHMTRSWNRTPDLLTSPNPHLFGHMQRYENGLLRQHYNIHVWDFLMWLKGVVQSIAWGEIMCYKSGLKM